MVAPEREICGGVSRPAPVSFFKAPRRFRYNAGQRQRRTESGPKTLKAQDYAMQETDNPFSEAFGKAVDLGNRIADTDDKADIWDIADGLLAGAVQYWLYSRQPCADPECEECVPISTAEGRIEELRRLMRQFAEESEYFHSPTDRNVGRA
jgi:hypothetical protein